MEIVMVARGTFWHVDVVEALPEVAVRRRRALSDSCLGELAGAASVATSSLLCEDASECSTAAGDDVDAGSEASSREPAWSDAAPEVPPGTFFVAPPVSIAKSRRGTRFVADPVLSRVQPLQQLADGGQTTVALRGLPRDCDQETLRAMLEAGSFQCCCDFLYLPYNFKKTQIFGYAILNFKTQVDAERAIGHFAGVPIADDCLTCDWSTSIQGLDALIQKYRNSSVMHPMVPSVYRPCLLSNGLHIPFHGPTVELKPPAWLEMIKSPHQ